MTQPDYYSHPVCARQGREGKWAAIRGYSCHANPVTPATSAGWSYIEELDLWVCPDCTNYFHLAMTTLNTQRARVGDPKASRIAEAVAGQGKWAEKVKWEVYTAYFNHIRPMTTHEVLVLMDWNHYAVDGRYQRAVSELKLLGILAPVTNSHGDVLRGSGKSDSAPQTVLQLANWALIGIK